MKALHSVLAAVTLASLIAFVSCRPNERYRTSPSDPDRPSSDWQHRRHARARDVRMMREGYSSWTLRRDQQQGIGNYNPWLREVYRPPVYIRRQPFDRNTGYPPDNPPQRLYQAPPYLPPRKPSNAPDLGNRVNSFEDDDEDRPIWYNSVNESPAPPAASIPQPTRLPRPPNFQEYPPLVHTVGSGNDAINHLSLDSEEESDVMPPPRPALTTARPPPPPEMGNFVPPTEDTDKMYDEIVNQLFDKEWGQSHPQSGTGEQSKVPSAPTTRRTTTSRPRPPAPTPSNCVWAVISCCSATSNDVAEQCFEQKGCPGPFWDDSPCDNEFAKAAVASALDFYNQ